MSGFGKRQSIQPSRFHYTGLGQPSETQPSTSLSTSRRQCDPQTSVPATEIAEYDKYSNEELRQLITDHEELIRACEDTLNRCQPIANALEAKEEGGWNEEEVTTWNKIKPEIHNAKITWSNRSDEIKKIRYVLGIREEQAVQQNVSKTTMEKPKSFNENKNGSSSSSSSATHRKRQAELDLKKEVSRLQRDRDEARALVEKKIKALHIQLEDNDDNEDVRKVKREIKLLELEKTSILEDHERKIKYAEKETGFINEQIDIEDEEYQDVGESLADIGIPQDWAGFVPQAGNHVQRGNYESIVSHDPSNDVSSRVVSDAINNVSSPPRRSILMSPRKVRFVNTSGEDGDYHESRESQEQQNCGPLSAFTQGSEGNLLAQVLQKQLELMEFPKNWDKKDLPTFTGRAEDWPIFKNEFYRTTPKGKTNSSENLIRLRKSLGGSALEAVKGLLHEPGNVNRIINMLQDRFGRSELVIQTLIEKAENAKAPEIMRPETFLDYGTTVLHLVETVRSLKQEDYLNDKSLLCKLTGKLPAPLACEWITWISDRPFKRENLASFGEWIDEKMRVMVRIVRTDAKEDTCRTPLKSWKAKGSTSINATTLDQAEETTVGEHCVCCGKGSHKLKNCFKFKKETLSNKLTLVKDEGLCFGCLQDGHMKRDCSSKKICGIDDCQSTHHPLLHSKGKSWKAKAVNGSDSRSDENTEENADDLHGGVSSNAVAAQSSSKPLSIVRIKVTGPKGTRKVYALLDSGADTTIVEGELARSLGIEGPQITHHCRGIGGKRIVAQAESVGFTISGNYKKAKEFKIQKAVTMEHLGLAPYTQNFTDAKKKWKYLKRAKLEDFENVTPQLLIGEDNPYLTAHRELLQGGADDPMAKRTILGWVLAGRKLSSRENTSSVNVMSTQEGEHLDQLMRSCFSVDSFGVYPLSTEGSVEDRRALQILKDTVRKVGNRWECGLLWRDETVKLPGTSKEALCRLISNERRMKRNQMYSDLYHNKIDEYSEKGYITELTTAEANLVSSKTLYIPHFGVFNVNKPGRIRLVFDAACKAGGSSLNDHLLTGPDLIRPLTTVLMNFRLHNVVINGDVEDMFHRVLVRKEDRDSQRFLWRDLRSGDNASIKTYVMNVLIFGACPSPSTAIYVKNRNAEEFINEFPEAVRAIVEDHYCDDCLTGAQTLQEAIKLREQISYIMEAGNFHLRKWISNKKQVIESIPKNDRAAGVKEFGDKTQIPTERVLGLWWNPQEDIFTFTANYKKVDPSLLEGRRPTKREASRLLMSVFDPLGFIANFRIKGLILLQRTWRTGIDWDDEISEDIYQEWKVWVSMLKETVNIKVPRLYCYDIHLATSVQLHTLVDASEEACSVVCYLRIKVGETVSLAFIAAKTKVAPTKKLTIPRLELLAAVIGACLADTITKELRIKICKRFFWSDSKTVLMWIRSEILRYKEFVANRISRIHLLSIVSEWRWIPTKLNIADQGTRLKSMIELNPDSTWINGPDFLIGEQDSWPIENKSDMVDEEQEELRSSISATTTENSNCCVVEIDRFSSFSRMRRAQAAVIKSARHWLCKARKQVSEAPWALKKDLTHPNQNKDELSTLYMRRVAKLLRSAAVSKLGPEDLREAELLLAKHVQLESFPEAINSLKSGKLEKSNRLWRLSPQLVDDVLRINGRIGASSLSYDQKNPVILPANHRFTELLILHEHERNAHQGQSTVLANIRTKYWVIEGRAAIRRIVGKCQSCKILGARPVIPCMGNLPSYRVSSGKPPFYFTGVDLYGPVEVVVGRHHEKRWVCLFTCMVTRAIHLEVVYALTTDETLMALSRFMDSRGKPGHIYSDNGTNFVGAKRVMKTSWEDVDWEEIMSKEKFQEVKWQFSPPCSPHFGGAWERMVQSVKKVLKRTLSEKFPKDQTLFTMLKGAENIINSRPLTYISGDPTDDDPLTPNHFLRGFSYAGQGIPGNYDTSDEMLRVQWRRAQFFLEQFWRQWTREVLPEMIRRNKWYNDVDPLEVGELVLLVDDQAPRNTWIKGIITGVCPGEDGQVRVVDVATVDVGTGRRKSFRRGVDKICPLGLRSENQSKHPDFGGRNVDETGGKI